MEIDTGASLSVLSEGVYWDLHNKGKLPHLAKTEVVLRTYTREEVKPKGSLDVMVIYEEKEYHLPLLVVQGKGPALLGKNWLEKLKLNWHMIKQLTPGNQQLREVVQKYPQLFEESLGTLKGATAKIYIDQTATPIFHKVMKTSAIWFERRRSSKTLIGWKKQEQSNQSDILNGLLRLFQ